METDKYQRLYHKKITTEHTNENSIKLCVLFSLLYLYVYISSSFFSSLFVVDFLGESAWHFVCMFALTAVVLFCHFAQVSRFDSISLHFHTHILFSRWFSFHHFSIEQKIYSKKRVDCNLLRFIFFLARFILFKLSFVDLYVIIFSIFLLLCVCPRFVPVSFCTIPSNLQNEG